MAPRDREGVCAMTYPRRPGQAKCDPGPIRRGPSVRALALETFCKQGLLRRMGPGVRRDDECRYFFGRIASGVSGCIDGCALANSGSAIAVSKMRFTVG